MSDTLLLTKQLHASRALNVNLLEANRQLHDVIIHFDEAERKRNEEIAVLSAHLAEQMRYVEYLERMLTESGWTPKNEFQQRERDFRRDRAKE